MKRSNSIKGLIKLYLAFHINKMVLIVFLLLLVVWSLVLVLNAGVPIDMPDYFMSPKSFHSFYFNQSLFFLQIINGVIVSFLLASELNSLNSFDPMFVSNTSRTKILCAKLFANILLLIVVVASEVLIMHLIAVIVFPEYVFSINSLVLIGYLLLILVMLILIGELICMINNSFFTPIIIFILNIFQIIFFQSGTYNDIVTLIIPKIYFKDVCFPVLDGNIITISSVLILLFTVLCLIFQKKDIS